MSTWPDFRGERELGNKLTEGIEWDMTVLRLKPPNLSPLALCSYQSLGNRKCHFPTHTALFESGFGVSQPFHQGLFFKLSLSVANCT